MDCAQHELTKKEKRERLINYYIPALTLKQLSEVVLLIESFPKDQEPKPLKYRRITAEDF